MLPQNGENAYVATKNPRASRALWWTLDPSQLGLISFTESVKMGKNVLDSLNQTLDPPLTPYKVWHPSSGLDKQPLKYLHTMRLQSYFPALYFDESYLRRSSNNPFCIHSFRFHFVNAMYIILSATKIKGSTIHV